MQAFTLAHKEGDALVEQTNGVDEPRWNKLLGQGFRNLLDDVPDKDFATRFLSEENCDRLERIREELGIDPVDVMQLCLDATPSGMEKAPAPGDIEKDAAWLSEDVLPRFQRILGYMSEPFTVRNPEPPAGMNRWPRPPREKPYKSETGKDDPRSALEMIREALRHPEPVNANPSLPRSPIKVPRVLVLRRVPLVFPPRLREVIATLTEVASVLKKRGHALASPEHKEPDEAKNFFLAKWEGRTLRIQRIARTLETRAATAGRHRREEEASIGVGTPTREWDQLSEYETRLAKRFSKWNSVLQNERRIRAEHGRGLFFVIYGSTIEADAYEKRLARLDGSNLTT